MLKLPEVAQRLGVSEKTARRYIKSGAIPSVFIGNAYRIREEDLNEYMRQAQVTPEGAVTPKVAAPLSLSEASAAPASFSELPGLMAARERRGISRNELTALSSVSPSDIAGLEEGTREATPDILERLTAALGATPGELGFPPEQYASHLEADERDNERIRRELAELNPSEVRALIMRSLLESRGVRKVRDAINEGLEQQAREHPEAG